MTYVHDCITNQLERVHPVDRPRPCVQKVFDESSGRWVPAHYAACDNDLCRGCVPREAEHGHLCRACYARVKDALGRVERMIVHLRSIEKAAQAVGERVDTSSANRLVLPETWQAGDGLMDALGAPTIPSTATIDDTFRLARDAVYEWADVDAIIESREGAKRAVVMVKRLQTAVKRWPDAEADWRRIPLMLCPSCGQATLHRQGPLEAGDDLMVRCAGSNLMYEQGIGYDTCTWILDWFQFVDTYQSPIEAAFGIHRKKWEAA